MMLQRFDRIGSVGFTLVELMVVVAIVATLAALAIPQFSEYRLRALNTSALSDIKNLGATQEAFFVNNQRYAVTHDHEVAKLPLAAVKTTGDLLKGPTRTFLAIAQFAKGVHRELPIVLGNNVLMQADVDAEAISYVAVSKHLQGNTMYGGGSESSAVYRDDVNLGSGHGSNSEGSIPITNFVPSPIPQQDVFVDAEISGKWVAL